jgi:hypothetical protein
MICESIGTYAPEEADKRTSVTGLGISMDTNSPHISSIADLLSLKTSARLSGHTGVPPQTN